MKYTRIITSLVMVLGLGALVAAGTGAFFTDSETSQGNMFVAGDIDLTVDHAYASYLGEECTSGCDAMTPSGVTATVDENSNANAEVLSFVHPAWTADLDGLPGAQWIWVTNPVSDPTIDQTFTFTQTFNWNGTVTSALLYVASDNTHRAYVNGTLVGASTDEDNFTLATEDVYNIAGALVVGLNTIKVEVDNKGVPGSTPTSNPAGVMFKAVIEGVCNPNAGVYTVGGACTLWDAKDLTDTDKFFDFSDVKPGDYGLNTISLHVESNDAYSCLFIQDVVNEENSLNDPELELADTAPEGELGDLLHFYIWLDTNNDQIKDGGETELYNDTLAGDIDIAVHDSTTGNGVLAGGTTDYVSVAWCAGELTLETNGTFTCNGESVTELSSTNLAQTDSLEASITAYATQSRNNGAFECADVSVGGGGPSSL